VSPAPAAPDDAIRSYRPAGTHVAGSTERDGAPALKPGTYVDRLGSDRLYYAVDVGAGATAYFSVTAVYARGLPGYPTLHVQVKSPTGSDCHLEDNAVSTQAGDGEPLTVAVHWDNTDAGGSKCSQPGRYRFQVWRNTDGGTRVPIELSVMLEPPIRGNAGTGGRTPVGFVQPTGAGRPVTGGGSFGSPATLSGSGRFTDTLQPREFVYYRVHLGWGQGLAYRVRYGIGGHTNANVKSALYSPARAPIATATAGYVGRPVTLPAAGALATLPIRYANRRSVLPSRQAESTAGWYYIAVKLGASGGAVPVEVDVAVVGHSVAGPRYGTIPPLPRPSSPGASSPPSTPPPSSSPSATPETPATTAIAGAKPTTQSSHGPRWWLLAAIAAAAAGAVAATAGWWTTRPHRHGRHAG